MRAMLSMLVGWSACAPAPVVEDPAPVRVLGVPVILPARPTSEDALDVVIPVDDVDDAEVTFMWEVDGVEAGTGPTLTARPRGSVVQVRAVRTVAGEVVQSEVAAPVVVANALPVISALVLTPAAPRTDDVVQATYTASDADGDTLQARFVWTVDGVARPVTTASLDGSWFDKGQRITLWVEVDDGAGGLAWQEVGTEVEDTPSPPATVSTWPNLPLEGASDVLCLLEDLPADPDGDAQEVTFTFLRDGQPWTPPQAIAGKRRPGDTVAAAWTSAGERWSCEASVLAGGQPGEPGVPSAEVEVAERRFVDLAVARGAYCALRTDGGTACAGAGPLPLVDLEGGPWTDIAGSPSAWCALDAEGALSCATDSHVGFSLGAAGVGPFVDVAVNERSAVAVGADGALVAFVRSHAASRVVDEVPEGSFRSVHLRASDDACAVRTSGSLFCWGQAAPTGRELFEGSDVARFGAASTTCAVLSSGELVCDRTGSSSWGPSVTQGPGWSDFAASSSAACGVRTTGEVVCWGAVEAPPSEERFRRVALSDNTACGLTEEDQVLCWGQISELARGTARGTARRIEQAPGALCVEDVVEGWRCEVEQGVSWTSDVARAVDVRLAGTARCALEASGTIVCGDRAVEGGAMEAPLGTFSRMESGGDRFCAWPAGGGDAVCWGEAESGAYAFPPPSGGMGFEDVSLSEYRACVLNPRVGVVCWDRSGPVEGPPGGVRVARLAAGDPRSALLTSDGAVQIWPVPDGPLPPAGVRFVEVVVGESVCARAEAGWTACWAESNEAWRRAPTVDEPFVDLEAHDRGTCGLTLDGRLHCWGTTLVREDMP